MVSEERAKFQYWGSSFIEACTVAYHLLMANTNKILHPRVVKGGEMGQCTFSRLREPLRLASHNHNLKFQKCKSSCTVQYHPRVPAGSTL